MNVALLIVRSNYVINRILIAEDEVAGYTYPLPHDLQIVDTNTNVHIGDWYEEAEGLFYRPIGIPADWPEELTQNQPNS